MQSASHKDTPLDQDIILYTVRQDWLESAATWYKRTTTADWFVGGGSYETELWRTKFTNVVASVGQWISIDVPASLIEGWIADPSSNHGFFLRPEEDEGGTVSWGSKDEARFASSEHSTAANRPKLRINYSGPGGNISPVLAFETSARGSVDLGTDIDMTATACDLDGSITSVQFLDNGAVIADFSSPPYTHTWRASPMGVHTVTAVASDNSGASVTNSVTTTVKWLELDPDPFYTNNLDTADGWTLEGCWEYEQPDISMNFYDPVSGYTGPNVMGTVVTYANEIYGRYPNNMTNTDWTTSPAIDCTGSYGVTLSFWRWLMLYANDWVFIEVSGDNGNTWQTIWMTAEAYSSTGWNLFSVDISAVADNKSQVKIRWGLGPTDASGNYGGLSIDDISLHRSITNGLYDSDSDGLEDTWELVTYGNLAASTGALEVTYQGSEFLVTEGSNKTADVVLNGCPMNTVTVQVARATGDSDISVSPSELVFTPANWSNAQTVTIAAAPDADALYGTATVQLTAPGFIGASFTAQEFDTDANLTPGVVNEPAATSLSATSAELSGTRIGGFAADAWICWGDTDGGTTSTGDWENVVSVGS
ncbi:hypothetical protein BVX97_05140, partial [bacterium E08(2017)]